MAVEVLDEIGSPCGRGVPKPLIDEVVQVADFVITMGCGDACPDLLRAPLHGLASG
jgi:arsenate reductase